MGSLFLPLPTRSAEHIFDLLSSSPKWDHMTMSRSISHAPISYCHVTFSFVVYSMIEFVPCSIGFPVFFIAHPSILKACLYYYLDSVGGYFYWNDFPISWNPSFLSLISWAILFGSQYKSICIFSISFHEWSCYPGNLKISLTRVVVVQASCKTEILSLSGGKWINWLVIRSYQREMLSGKRHGR